MGKDGKTTAALSQALLLAAVSYSFTELSRKWLQGRWLLMVLQGGSR